MPTREEILRTKTFKDAGVDLPRRVFYTLNSDKNVQTHRNSQAIAHIVKHLHEQGILSDDAIDDMLFELVM